VNTTLDRFTLCRDCAAEYADPMDRRFHAEPLACEVCGPALSWHDGRQRIGGNAQALVAAVAALRDGQIVAVRVSVAIIFCAMRATSVAWRA